jgi:hypothetical protein
MIYGYRYDAQRNRIPNWIDRRYKIQGYGEDNLYPQRAMIARDNSKTVLPCTAAYAEFLSGGGFTDPSLSALVVNRKGHTANDLLDHIARSMSWANGFFIHVGYNLNYKISSLKLLNFEYNRFGLPDEDGDFYDIKYCTNWENDPNKNYNGAVEICDYPTFNPYPEVVKSQIEAAGGILNYKGQIFYWTPEEGQYPRCTFDVVLDEAQTQTEIALFDLSMEQNGFKAGHVMTYPGKFETPEEQSMFMKGINQFTGRGAGSVLVLENPDGTLKANEIITPLQMQNTDGLHTNVDKRTKDAIRETFGMPPEIIGYVPESGAFSTQQMQDAYTYYNLKTQTGRNIISRQLKKLFTNWKDPIATTFDILPKAYSTGTQTMTNNG